MAAESVEASTGCSGTAYGHGAGSTTVGRDFAKRGTMTGSRPRRSAADGRTGSMCRASSVGGAVVA
ncbi:MAG TPA: hypothetical protein VF170_08460, partial [Planctomycetaceae bacterium]